MREELIPSTDLRPRGVGLGTADLGVRQDEPSAHRLLDRFVALGGNLLDTARVYSDWIPGESGRSERIIGDWIRQRGHHDDVIVSTKGGHPRLDRMDTLRLDEPSLCADVDLSLHALRVDAIDLFFLHRDAPDQPVEPFIDVLNRLCDTGKIRWFGASNWTAARIAAANTYAAASGQRGFVASQSLWNLGSGTMHRPPDPTLVVVDHAEARALRPLRIAHLPYSGQAGGYFSKLVESDDSGTPTATLNPLYDTPANRALAEPVRDLAQRHACRVNAVVLAYLSHQASTVVPVVGCSRPEQLESTWDDLNVPLSPAELATLQVSTG
ncbi:aldo/keto reductase [Synoicihabitans lomoniglobus]|uniref:Aldo/keto reductase n=1 Tax=Synoicihabitans lomoniglobus TaxID=2909285 RepID=A0AAE9ZU90_9BACT|nr:aldo/keto reductase [Opitutaceae bacterium LMO-M01]WED63174.1 aldo/keto reductase [Opitutaceae bacterium LMO-M01]